MPVNVQGPDPAKAAAQEKAAADKAAAWKQTQENQAAKLSGFEQQLKAAQSAEADYAKQEGALMQGERADKRALTRQAAATMARTKNLGTLRGAAEQTGIGRAQVGTQYAQQQMANAANRRLAQMQAGELQSALAEERQKALVASTTGRTAAANQAKAAAQKILDAEAEKQWFTFDVTDRQRTADRIRREVLAGVTDPQVAAELENWIDQNLGENADVSGLIDV